MEPQGGARPRHLRLSQESEVQRQADTNLIIAAFQGHLSILQELLKHGANPLAEEDGKTALSFAAGMGYQECVKALLQVVPPNSVKENPVLQASRGGHTEVVKMLVQAGWSLNCSDSAGYTSLHYAAMGGDLEVTKYLLEQGVNPLQENLYGSLPLDTAI